MKVRIVYDSALGGYYPQYKRWFFWKNFTRIINWDDGDEVKNYVFGSLEDAREFLEQRRSEKWTLSSGDVKKRTRSVVYEGEIS